jgi:hypothetical protein
MLIKIGRLGDEYLEVKRCFSTARIFLLARRSCGFRLFFNRLPGGAYGLIEVIDLADQLDAGLARLLLSRGRAIYGLAVDHLFIRILRFLDCIMRLRMLLCA